MTNKQRAAVYLQAAKKYDKSITLNHDGYSSGVCPYLYFINDKEDWKEWYLFMPDECPIFWWDDHSPERVLALLFAHEIALNP